MNDKKIKKPYEILFTPPQKINTDLKVIDNSYKLNPLKKKNKIIKKHNILQKIDFNINKSNDKRNLDLKLYINKYNLYNNKVSNKNKEAKINLPLLENFNKDRNPSCKRINNIHLYTNNNISLTFNSFLPTPKSSPSVKLYNNVEIYNNIFTNEKIKNSNIKIPKINIFYTDTEIQTNNNFNTRKENNESNLSKIQLNINDKEDKVGV